MKPLSVVHPTSVVRVVLAAAIVVGAHAAAVAQPVTKAPPRLPANPTASGRIPAGVDTGSPGSSDTLQLGTPVPPTMGSEGGEMRARGAAARAAARPKPVASGADCVRPAKGASAPAAAKPGGSGASRPANTVGGMTTAC